MSKYINTRNLSISDFYCTQCGCKNFPIFRPNGRAKEPGHLKKLFCLNCKDYKNMVEIKPKGKYTLSCFLYEFKHGNFDINGNRKEDWKTFVQKRDKINE